MHKVLLVDDEAIIRNAISRMVNWEGLGCELVATASNGSEAYQVYLDMYPEIIITDLSMPVMDGLEFIAKVREKDKDVKIIILSGYGEFEYAQKAIRLGARDYLLKPVRVEDVEKIVGRSVKEIESDLSKKTPSIKDVGYFRVMLLELLTSPDRMDEILKRYLSPSLEEEGGVFVIAIESEGEGDRRTLVRLAELARVHEFELLTPPLKAGNEIYAVFLADGLEKYRNAIGTLGEKKDFSKLFHGSLEAAFHFILDNIALSKTLTIYTKDGKNEIFSNEAGYIKRISQLSEKLSMLLSSDNSYTLLAQIRKDMEELPLEEAKSLLLRLIVSYEGNMNEILSEAMQKIKNAESTEDILQYIQNLASRQVNRGSAVDDGTSYPVRRIKEYVEAHYSDENLSLKAIAEDVVFMDAAYLSKLFHKEVGMKFSDYVNQYRITKAKELMRLYHNSLIFEIAEHVGFGNNPRYFSQVFKKYAGISPSDYIKDKEKKE